MNNRPRVNAGIDLGTTNSIVCFIREGSETVEKLTTTAGGKDYIRSVVGYENGTAVVGEEALEKYKTQELDEFYERFKMYLPISDTDSALLIEKLKRDYNWPSDRLPFFVAKDYLSKLIASLSESEGEIDSIVLSVPELWQKDGANLGAASLVRIAEELNLPLLQLVPEPVAAAAYYSHSTGNSGRILVCDMGGGTFDVSLCNVEFPKAEVLDHWGIGSFGTGKAGVLFDREIARRLFKKIHAREADETNPDDRIELVKVAEAFENKKIKLSKSCWDNFDSYQRMIREEPEAALVRHVYLVEYGTGIFKVFCSEVQEAFAPIDQEIRKVLAAVPKGSFEHLVIVGGFGQFPWVVKSIHEALGVETFDRDFHRRLDSYFAVAKGAALIAAKKIDVIERYPHRIGIVGKMYRSGAGGKEGRIEELRIPIIASGSRRDDRFHWAAEEFTVNAGSEGTVDLYVDLEGDEARSYRHSASVRIPQAVNGNIFHFGVRVNRNNIPELYFIDKESKSCGSLEHATKLILTDMIPDFLVKG